MAYASPGTDDFAEFLFEKVTTFRNLEPSRIDYKGFRNYDCDDLTYDQAQQVLDSDPSDPHGLDADGNQIACE